jgi:hypothetical protein
VHARAAEQHVVVLEERLRVRGTVGGAKVHRRLDGRWLGARRRRAATPRTRHGTGCGRRPVGVVGVARRIGVDGDEARVLRIEPHRDHVTGLELSGGEPRDRRLLDPRLEVGPVLGVHAHPHADHRAVVDRPAGVPQLEDLGGRRHPWACSSGGMEAPKCAIKLVHPARATPTRSTRSHASRGRIRDPLTSTSLGPRSSSGPR